MAGTPGFSQESPHSGVSRIWRCPDGVALARSLPRRRQEAGVVSERFAMVSGGGGQLKAAGVHGRFPLYRLMAKVSATISWRTSQAWDQDLPSIGRQMHGPAFPTARAD